MKSDIFKTREKITFLKRVKSDVFKTRYSVNEKLQDTRAKVAPVNLIYGSHFSSTEAIYKVSQNVGNFVEFTRYKPVPV